MSRKRVLYVLAQHAAVYAVEGGRLIDEGEFSVNDEGLAAFAIYLQRERESLFYVLGDLPEEEFQQENIPHVTGSDRAALVARKLAQIFRDTKLSQAISLGSEPGTRRDERVLFAAFTNTQFFHPWLKALHGHEIRLAGVYSIALMGKALFRKLGLKDHKLLIVSVHRSGIRQNYFEGGQIRFSRLTANVETDARRTAEACMVESGKLLQYLEGLRLASRDGPPLRVLLVAPRGQFGVFSEVCTGSQRLVIEVADEQAVAARIGLRSLPAGTRSEALFCFLLGQRAPTGQYAPKTQRRMFRLWQMRMAIFAAAGALSAACMLFAGGKLVEVMDIRYRTDIAKTQSDQDAQRYEEIRKTFPQLPTTPDNLKSTVQRFVEIERLSATPKVMLLQISNVLNAFPGIDLDRIEWAVTQTPAEVGEADPTRIPVAPVVQIAPAVRLAQDKTRYQVAYVTGRIMLPNRIDYRGLLEYLDQFADGLRKTPGIRVDLVKLPFDTRSGAKLSGGVTTDQTPAVPLFALRVVRKI